MSIESRKTKKATLFLLIFILVSLGIRLFLINWYSAPYTDGVFLMTLFESYNENNNYPPLYSALLSTLDRTINDPITSGRLISILSGVGLIGLIFHFGNKLFREKTGLIAALIYGTTPLVFRWDLRVMTDSMFTLLFCLSLYFLLQTLNLKKRSYFLLFNFFAALSALTRYQGLVFLPLVFYLFYHVLLQQKSSGKWLYLLAGLICWLCVPAWMVYRGFSQIGQYQESMHSSLWENVASILSMMQMLLHAMFYAFGYLASALMIYGVVSYGKNPARLRGFLPICGYLFFAFWLAHSAFMRAFQTRYFLPLWPLAALFAAWGIVELSRCKPYLARAFLSIILVSNIFWSGMVLHFQRDSFGALRRSAEFIARHLPEADIVTTEFYKLAFFAGRNQRGKPRNQPDKLSILAERNLRSGFYVYTDTLYQPDFFSLFQDFSFEVVYKDRETVMPILPDVIQSTSHMNNIEWLSTRFKPWTTDSMILKVVNK